MEILFYVQPGLALDKPAIRLVIDSALPQSFLDEVARRVQRWRLLPALFGPRRNRLLVEVLNRFGIDLYSGTKTRIQVIAQVELRGHHFPYFRFAQAALLFPGVVLLRGGERLPQPLQAPFDLRIRGAGQTRYVPFRFPLHQFRTALPHLAGPFPFSLQEYPAP